MKIKVARGGQSMSIRFDRPGEGLAFVRAFAKASRERDAQRLDAAPEDAPTPLEPAAGSSNEHPAHDDRCKHGNFPPDPDCGCGV